MAAAAAGAGSGPWAAQEKFPPALLSFFVYNPGSGRAKERTRFIVHCRSSATACTRTLRGSRTAAGPRWAVPAHVPGHSAGEPAHHPGHQR
ncbi:uncharacterized protein LOC129060287 isoform X2 [Pongo abelii]|uniref:uncharacterized protein LOC129060287 isoform X2 n=1 Tax=Pongo abelii TaxID=9601 RepID=UPI0030042476